MLIHRHNRPRSILPSTAAYDPVAELQWWYFDAVLRSGHRLLIFFLPRFTGSIDGNEPGLPMLNIALKTPDGEIIRERRFFRPSEFTAARDRVSADFGSECSVHFEPITGARGGGVYRLRATAGRIGCDLEIAPELPPWAPARNGFLPRPFIMLLNRSLTTRDYFHYVPLVPRGTLKGRIVVDGDTIEARGTAYHEQGRLNFCLARLSPAWYWLHIECPPWTILSGTAMPPRGVPRPARGLLGGIGFVQRDDQCLLAAFDPTGLLVKWPLISKQNLDARDGERRLAWTALVKLARVGLRVSVDVHSREVLEYIPFNYNRRNPRQPFWGQTLADVEVEILQRRETTRFRSQGVLETMVTGG